MLDIKLFDETREGGPEFIAKYRETLKNRNHDVDVVDTLMNLNIERKRLIHESEQLRSEQKAASQEIGRLKKEGQDASDILQKMSDVSKRVKELEGLAHEADEKVHQLALTIPNICHESVPVGKGEEQNRIERVVGEPPQFDFEPKEHFDLTEDIDFDRAAKVTGARFSFLRGQVAKIERALIQFMMDLQSNEHGYTEIIPPYMINSESLVGTGQFPKFRDDVFHIEGTDYHLCPTAEVPVTNYYRDEILSEEQLPTRFCAFSPCFRSEAGSHGRDTRGLIRQHQFHKVELLIFSRPEESYEEHERLLSNAEEVLRRLKLHYRVATLSTGDIGFGAAKCYDLEVWLPGQKAFREISSCSNFEDFQARRANIRFRPEGGGKPQFVHTLNGSGLAIGRTLVAVLENYQRADGTIEIPDVLKPYIR